jgi:hypothetical protein
VKHATQQQTTAPQQEKAHGTKHKSPQEILEFQSKMRIDQSTHQEALTAGAFFSSSRRWRRNGERKGKYYYYYY